MTEVAVRLDLRGEECPVPTRKTIDALRGARARDEELVVVTDDAICAADIPYEAGRLGYAARTVLTAASEWTITLTPPRRGATEATR